MASAWAHRSPQAVRGLRVSRRPWSTAQRRRRRASSRRRARRRAEGRRAMDMDDHGTVGGDGQETCPHAEYPEGRPRATGDDCDAEGYAGDRRREYDQPDSMDGGRPEATPRSASSVSASGRPTSLTTASLVRDRHSEAGLRHAAQTNAEVLAGREGLTTPKGATPTLRQPATECLVAGVGDVVGEQWLES